MRFAIGSGELAISAQVWSAVLNRVSCYRESLNAIIKGDHFSDFVPNGLAGLAAQQLLTFGMNSSSQFEQNFPFSLGFPDLAGNFGAEHDSPFRNGFGSAAVLLITGLGRQQQ